MIKKLVIAWTGIVLVSSCAYDKEELLYPNGDCSSNPARFAADVQPIIQSRCAVSGCHAAGSTNGVGPLTSYNLIKSHAAEIRSAVVSGLMPKGSTLSSAEIQTIACWVDSGAPDN